LLEVLAGDLKVVLHPDGVLLDFEELVQTFAKVSLHAVKGEDLRGRVK
jgi:hypothetical protein